MTAIERALGAPAGHDVALPLDLVVSDDWTTPSLVEPLRRLGTRRTAVPFVIVHDHTGRPDRYGGSDRQRVERLVRVRDDVAARLGADRVIGAGIQHHALAESGHVQPGMRVLCNDSHAATLAGYGAIAFAGQPTTVAAALHEGVLHTTVPSTLRVHLRGRLGPGVTARDAGLAILARLRDADGVPRRSVGRALEFVGDGLGGLNPSERAVLANIVPEAMAVTALFTSDAPEPTLDGPTRDGASETRSDLAVDLGTDLAIDLAIDLADVRPGLAHGPDPRDVHPVDELPATPVDRVFVGTCAGGTWEEIAAFAAALTGPTSVPTEVVPATAGVAARLERSGLAARMREAGVTLGPPGCGACFGFGVRRLAAGEVAVTTGNRNGRGRMGSPNSTIHLVSGPTAAHAAMTGRIGTRASAPDRDQSPTARTPTSRPTHSAAPTVVPPRSGNVLRLLGPITTDDLVPSSVPGVGTSNDDDPGVLRELFLFHVRPGPGLPDLDDAVLVGDHGFGAGSNRASSVRALTALGIRAVVARSFAPLYAQGARDEGLTVVTLDDDAFFAACDPDARIDIDTDSGLLHLGTATWRIPPESERRRAIRTAGGIVPWLASRPASADDGPKGADDGAETGRRSPPAGVRPA